MRKIIICLLLFFSSDFTLAKSNENRLLIAVASNFAEPMKQLVAQFQQDTLSQVQIAQASSGKHYAQIVNGAPYDLFFSASPFYIEQLLAQSIGIEETRFIYAEGRLALWSPQPELFVDGLNYLQTANFKHLAIANPTLAPYGEAAILLLEKLNLIERMTSKLVRGENVGHALSFVNSGAADVALVAYSQVKQLPVGSLWLVPLTYHQPLRQQAFQLKSNPLAQQFLQFVKSHVGEQIIANFGYSQLQQPMPLKEPNDD